MRSLVLRPQTLASGHGVHGGAGGRGSWGGSILVDCVVCWCRWRAMSNLFDDDVSVVLRNTAERAASQRRGGSSRAVCNGEDGSTAGAVCILDSVNRAAVGGKGGHSQVRI